MSWFLKCLGLFATFSGRARRREYWYFVLFQIIIIIGLSFIDSALGMYDERSGLGPLSGIATLALLLPLISVTVRRLHDRNMSGWWAIAAFLPLISLVFLVIFALDGTRGPNRFGPDPKNRQPLPAGGTTA